MTNGDKEEERARERVTAREESPAIYGTRCVFLSERYQRNSDESVYRADHRCNQSLIGPFNGG